MTTITLTSENLHKLATNNCGFTRAQIEAVGFQWPPKKGWLKSLIGKTLTLESYNKVAFLREVSSAKLRKLKKQLAKQESLKGFACY